jgi:hypothetical protein
MVWLGIRIMHPCGATCLPADWCFCELGLDLQLPMQSVPITTEVVSSNLGQGEVYNTVG